MLIQPWSLRSLADERRSAVLSTRAWHPPALKAMMYRLEDYAVDFAYGPQLNAFRAELGLPPARRVFHRWFLSTSLVLGLWPEWLSGAQPDYPPQLRFCGFPLADGAGGRAADAQAALLQLSPALQAFIKTAQADGVPLVAVTLGSAPPPGAEAHFQAAVAGCALAGVRCVLLCGAETVGKMALPPHALLVKYAPFSALLPQVSVFMYNGGFGGVGQALAAGVPQLITPAVFDQYDNGNRMTKLGVAVTLPARDFTPQRCAKALGWLRSARVGAACEEARRRYLEDKAQPCCQAAAAAIVEVLGK